MHTNYSGLQYCNTDGYVDLLSNLSDFLNEDRWCAQSSTMSVSGGHLYSSCLLKPLNSYGV